MTIIYGVLIAAAIAYVLVAVPYLRAHRPATTTGIKPVEPWNFNALQPMKFEGAIFKLRERANELDGALFQLSLAITHAAEVLIEKLDFTSIARIESELKRKIQVVDRPSPGQLKQVVGELERHFTSCQVLSALIEVGPQESWDRSNENPAFESLLARARKTASPLQLRGIVADATGDVARAQRWLEIATIVLRVAPESARFSEIRVNR